MLAGFFRFEDPMANHMGHKPYKKNNEITFRLRHGMQRQLRQLAFQFGLDLENFLNLMIARGLPYWHREATKLQALKQKKVYGSPEELIKEYLDDYRQKTAESPAVLDPQDHADAGDHPE